MLENGRQDNLEISYEPAQPEFNEPVQAVFLYTPDMKDTDEHYHISLQPYQAKILHRWLTQFLEENK